MWNVFCDFEKWTVRVVICAVKTIMGFQEVRSHFAESVEEFIQAWATWGSTWLMSIRLEPGSSVTSVRSSSKPDSTFTTISFKRTASDSGQTRTFTSPTRTATLVPMNKELYKYIQQKKKSNLVMWCANGVGWCCRATPSWETDMSTLQQGLQQHFKPSPTHHQRSCPTKVVVCL